MKTIQIIKMSFPFSIYIPRMSIFYDEESVKRIFSQHHIGMVSHVDFTPFDKKIGFKENMNGNVKSAFIHFSSMPITIGLLRYNFNQNFWITLMTENSIKIFITENEYWICLKNNNPIERTMMNIHQVVENGRYLENLLLEQSKKIDEQAKIIDELSSKLDDIYSYLDVSRAK